MIFDRIAIGTANWGKPYRGVQFPEDQIPEVLTLCDKVGIDIIDTAVDYDCDDLIRRYIYCEYGTEKFSVVRKVDPRRHVITPDMEFHDEETIISHTDEYFGHGATYYDVPDQAIPPQGIANIPYSVFDRRWEPVMESYPTPIYFARSIFMGGQAFSRSDIDMDHKVRDFHAQTDIPIHYACLMWVLMNPRITAAVIGFNNIGQFCNLLEGLLPFERLMITDENLLDLRRSHELDADTRSDPERSTD